MKLFGIKPRRPGRRVYLHCGTHKTGTSSLQHFLCGHRELLADQGFYYPQAGVFSHGHHNLAWELTKDARFKDTLGNLDAFMDEITASKRDVIVSSEDFEGVIADTPTLLNFVARLKRAGLQPTIIVYLRAQDNYALSLYLELLKHGYERDLTGFIGEIVSQGILTYRAWKFWFDYDELLRHLREAECELKLRHYSDKPRTDVVADFCKLLAIKVSLKGRIYEDNPRVTLQQAYALFLKNSQRAPSETQNTWAAELSGGARADLGTDLRKQLAARFDSGNRGLRKYLDKTLEVRPYAMDGGICLEKVFC